MDATTNVDVIKDFNPKTELFALPSEFFPEIASGDLSEAAFTLTSEVTTTDTRILYDTTTGAIFYDADGSDTAFSAIQFATLVGKPTISETNFFVV